MTGIPFIMTIDTEGDNIWDRPTTVVTRNARYLDRFQALCETYRLKPTYLTNYEMAVCPDFNAFAQDMLQRGTGEIGMHLHAWNSPPERPLTANDNRFQPYLIEYPAVAIAEKVAFMTDLLEERFQVKMTSHRAGRWAFDATYAGELIRHGYEVDCSITPHVSWRATMGDPEGRGGGDYSATPELPYFVDPSDPRRPGLSSLLEIPMTIRKCGRGDQVRTVLDRTPKAPMIVRRVINRLFPLAWLRPNGRNRTDMLWLLDQVAAQPGACAEFMLHSSELMPGGSPRFATEEAIERLYDDMEALFAATQGRFEGLALTEAGRRYRNGALIKAASA